MHCFSETVFLWGINTSKGAQNISIKRLTLASLLVPYPPRNISVQIVPINRNNWEEHSGNFAEESFMEPQEIMKKEKHSYFSDNPPEIPAVNTTAASAVYRHNSTEYETTSQPYWWSNEAESSEGEEEFVNAVSSDYEASDVNTSGKLNPEPPSFLPVQMVVTWLPPKPPTAFDGFHINIEREGKPEPYSFFILIFCNSIGACLLYKSLTSTVLQRALLDLLYFFRNFLH